MITIFKRDKQVIVQIENGPLFSNYQFDFNCGDPHYAALLTTHFNDRLASRIEAIRKEEYDKGWRDAKSKKVPKKNWFSSLLKNSY